MSFTKKTISSIIAIAVSCISCTAIVLFALPVSECYSQEATSQTVVKYYKASDLMSLADGIIEWAKKKYGISNAESLSDSKTFLEFAGESSTDWYVIGETRLHPEKDFPFYLDALTKKMALYYVPLPKNALTPTNKPTPKGNYTDYQRRAMTILALKGDPRNIKYTFEDKTFTADAISDFAFNMGTLSNFNNSGIMSQIWALISIDSMQYTVPAGSKNTRETLIKEILSQQLSNGGYSLLGPEADKADPDITSMVLQAFAPYYNSSKIYTYTIAGSGSTKSKTIRKAVDESLQMLSSIQSGTGDIASGGMPNYPPTRNPQTTAQVTLALTCLGIDPQLDGRFIKNGKSLVDGMLAFLQPDKGFKATVNSTKSDSLASSQVLYTMAAIIRNMKSMRRLYDLRPEQPSTLKANIAKITAEIVTASDQTPRPKLLSISNSYKLIADSEKMYVYNYTKLYDLLNKKVSTNSNTPASSINSITSNNLNNSGQGPGPSNSSTSNNSETGNESISQSSFLNSSEGMSQSEKDGNSNSKDSGDRNLRIFILVVIIVLIISGATLNFYMIRKARIKRG